MTRILILCTGNSARSQMAEAWLRALDPALDVHSAGTRPAARVNPEAVAAMAEIGIDIAASRPKAVDEFLGRRFDYVITVCDHANETCPAFHGPAGRRLHMGFEDPLSAEAFRRVRDAIRERFERFYREEIIVLRPAAPGDLEAVRALLARCETTDIGLADQFGAGYVLACRGAELAGVAGIERYGAYGLLRSVAVTPEFQRNGIGRRMVEERMEWAREQGLAAVHLLTITAPGYFEKAGFRRVSRGEVPEEIRRSWWLDASCPENAVVMVRESQ